VKRIATHASIGIRQRAQEDRIGDAEHCGSRGDSQCQRKYGRRCEGGPAPQNAGGITNVLPEAGEAAVSANFASGFHNERGAAEQAAGFHFGLPARHAALHQLLGFDRQVSLQFVFEIGVGRRFMKNVPPHSFTP
jgi:hypothetical protein